MIPGRYNGVLRRLDGVPAGGCCCCTNDEVDCWTGPVWDVSFGPSEDYLQLGSGYTNPVRKRMCLRHLIWCVRKLDKDFDTGGVKFVPAIDPGAADYSLRGVIECSRGPTDKRPVYWGCLDLNPVSELNADYDISELLTERAAISWDEIYEELLAAASALFDPVTHATLVLTVDVERWATRPKGSKGQGWTYLDPSRFLIRSFFLVHSCGASGVCRETGVELELC